MFCKLTKSMSSIRYYHKLEKKKKEGGRYFRNMCWRMLTTASLLKSKRPMIMKTKQWHLEAESNLIYLTLKNKSLFF